MAEDLQDLPKSVAEIAEVIGRQNALALIGKLPRVGRREWRASLYVPKTMPLDHFLVKELGWPLAQKMSYFFPGMILQPSRCRLLQRVKRNKQIVRSIEEGVGVEEIADRWELSIYRVREIISHERGKQ